MLTRGGSPFRQGPCVPCCTLTGGHLYCPISQTSKVRLRDAVRPKGGVRGRPGCGGGWACNLACAPAFRGHRTPPAALTAAWLGSATCDSGRLRSQTVVLAWGPETASREAAGRAPHRQRGAVPCLTRSTSLSGLPSTAKVWQDAHPGAVTSLLPPDVILPDLGGKCLLSTYCVPGGRRHGVWGEGEGGGADS